MKNETNHETDHEIDHETDHVIACTDDQDVISTYISQFPENIQLKLNEMRALIRRVAPDATEKISYQMPTYYLEGNLVHFAGYKNHIGFYPTPSGISAFENEIKHYKYAKGSVQFPIDQSLPTELIERIVKFRVVENLSLSEKKKSHKVRKNTIE